MHKTIHEPAREIPVVAEADVVVCGGGPGGVPAAIAAARHGAKVVLIERYGFMGGLATAGLVSPILAHKAHAADFAIVEGILREITERMHALGGAPRWEETLKVWGINFDAECLKIVLDEMCQEAGVELLLHSYIADVATQDGQIAAVLVENKSGRQAVAGKVFVDATGDADVAFRAGAPTTHGRAWDGRPESMGSFIHLAGFAYPDEARRKEITARVQDEMAAGRLSFYNPGFLGRNDNQLDHTSANMTRFGGDSDNAADMTRAELSVRRDAWALVRFLRANVPGLRGLLRAAALAPGRPAREPADRRPVRAERRRHSSRTQVRRRHRPRLVVDRHPLPAGQHLPRASVPEGMPQRHRLPLLRGRIRADAHVRGTLPAGRGLVRHPLPLPALGGRAEPALVGPLHLGDARGDGRLARDGHVRGARSGGGDRGGAGRQADIAPAAVDVAGLRDALRRDGQLV